MPCPALPPAVTAGTGLGRAGHPGTWGWRSFATRLPASFWPYLFLLLSWLHLLHLQGDLLASLLTATLP